VVKSGNVKHFDVNPEGNRWVFRLLQSKALRKLPVSNIERLFTRFQEMQVENGQTIIREGDDGDYFYVLKEGAAAVSQLQDSGESVVAYLVRGDSFGEDALLSNNVRNATVTMMKDGKLMRLSKSDFSELLKQPVVEWVSPGKASISVRSGAGVIDVRTKEEFEERAIKGAVNMPLSRLREHASELDKSKRYIAYCNTGERSAAAAFVLNKLGFEAAALQGGLSAMVRQMDQIKKA
jgi:rhodanese-related sulfurtransferase